MAGTVKSAKQESAATAEHPGEADKDHARPAPGSGLEQRQALNTHHTGRTQRGADEPASTRPKTKT